VRIALDTPPEDVVLPAGVRPNHRLHSMVVRHDRQFAAGARLTYSFWRGGLRSRSAAVKVPDRWASTASFNVTAASRTSCWIAWSAASSAWLVA
jgi:hypothetical protein